MRELDTKEWLSGVNERSSLKIYVKWRKDLWVQDEVYQNDQASELLLNAERTT